MNTTLGHQTLTLTGLRFDANLGILEFEKTAPQPIQVDAELSLGTQPLLPLLADAFDITPAASTLSLSVTTMAMGVALLVFGPLSDAVGRLALIRITLLIAALIALVLLDLTMPDLDGEETFRELRRMDPNVCVVMSSGYTESEIAPRFAGKRLSGFLQKPYTLNALTQCLRGALGTQIPREELAVSQDGRA